MEQKLSTAPLQSAWTSPFSPVICTDDYSYLRQRAHSRQVRDRSEIFSQATRDFVFFIEAGLVRLFLESPSGHRLCVQECHGGSFFWQAPALPASLHAISQGHSSILQMPRARFEQALIERPGFAAHVASRSLSITADAMHNLAALMTGSLRNRVSAELLRLAPETEPPVVIRPAPSHAELGRAVGATREAVTRQLGRLDFDGVITTRRREIILLDPGRLRLAAGHQTIPLERP